MKSLIGRTQGPIARGTIRTTFVLGLRLVVQAGTLSLAQYVTTTVSRDVRWCAPPSITRGACRASPQVERQVRAPQQGVQALEWATPC